MNFETATVAPRHDRESIAMPQLRPLLLLHSHRLRAVPHRGFHASPRPQFVEATVSAALTATHTLLTTLHTTTALSWATIIPLTAVFLRLSITTPLTLFSRRRALKTLALQPLVSAWQHPLARAARRTTASPQAWENATRKAVRAKRKEIWKRHGCQAWKVWVAPAMQIPVWITASVTLRGMAGKEGLPEWVQEKFGSAAVAAVRERIVPLEPGFADEGALWFQSLLEPDLMMVLPFAFSFLTFANVEVSIYLSIYLSVCLLLPARSHHTRRCNPSNTLSQPATSVLSPTSCGSYRSPRSR